MKEIFVIAVNQKSNWVYYRDHEKYDLQWVESPYGAREFKTYEDAKNFLKSDSSTRTWGGFFRIEPLFVKR